MVTSTQNNQPQYQCSQYAYNPYLCAYAPSSQVVVPQGQMQMPQNIQQPPQIQVLQQPPENLPNINYSQVTPYLNTNSKIFTPNITTKSGQSITIAPPISSVPIEQIESKVVYEGPIKIINPQITPVEQNDNQIEKEFRNYFKRKVEFNDEFRKAVYQNKNKGPWWKNVLGFIGFCAVLAVGYKFRKKIPVIKWFCK
ncbi:hypothetical protein IJS77_01655 [bacterium]|nr:hypothetical protein [bacterium]